MKFVKLFSSFIFVENKAKKLSIAVAIVHFFNAVIREKKDSKNLIETLFTVYWERDRNRFTFLRKNLSRM